jgi:tripartite ATP-independent transporter DctP family solute receptor
MCCVKKSTVLLFVVLLIFALGLVVPNSSKAKSIEIKLAMPVSGDNPWGVGLKVFKKRVEEITKNQVEVKLYFASLGGSTKIIESVRSGVIQGGILSAGPLSNFVPEVGILNLPWLYSSWDHSELTIDGAFGKYIENRLYENGFKILSWFEWGGRDLSNRVRPINTPEDIKGLKVRVMQSPEFLALYKAYGAIPVPMSAGEVYTALQQGVIDGIETSLSAAYTLNVHEVAKYGASLGEVLAQNPLGVNAKWFDALPEEIQYAIAQAGVEATLANRRSDAADRALAIEKWKKAGNVVTFPEKGPFIEIGKSILPEFYEKVGGKKWVERILRTGEGLSDGLK